MKDHHLPKVLGTTTIGERGQIVIPSSLRKSMKIKTGDKFIVFSKHDFIGLLRSDRFEAFLEKMTGKISGHLEEINKLRKDVNKTK